MDEFYDDPVLGRLDLRAKLGGTGYVDINRRIHADGQVTYYAKTRLDLNKKDQSKVGGPYPSPREAAINLATYLKQNPPIPKRKVRSAPDELAACVSSCTCLIVPRSIHALAETGGRGVR